MPPWTFKSDRSKSGRRDADTRRNAIRGSILEANFGADRGMMLLKITGRDGITRRHGVLQIGGDYETITDLDLFTDWTSDKDPESIRVSVRTEARAARMTGKVLRLVPLRNRRKVNGKFLQTRIAEGLTEWDWDGLKGIGMTEYIEFLDDGEPVVSGQITRAAAEDEEVDEELEGEEGEEGIEGEEGEEGEDGGASDSDE